MDLLQGIVNPIGGLVVGISQPTDMVLGVSRLQRNYLWDVLLPDIHSLSSMGGILGKIGQGLENFNPGQGLGGFEGMALSQYCQAVEFGDYNIEEIIKMRYGAYQANFPGLFSIDKVRLTFLKTMPDIIVPYFYAWKNLIVDQNGLYNVKSKYQKTIYIRFLDATGITIQRYKLTGCFPTSFPKYTLDYKNNEVTQITVELAVDKLDIE